MYIPPALTGYFICGGFLIMAGLNVGTKKKKIII